MTLGAYLKSEREARGVLLPDIARETKIGIRMLEAIEADHFEALPGGVFRTSFIKSYARFLGLDAEKLLMEYPVPAGLCDTPEVVERKPIYKNQPKDRIKSMVGLGAGVVVVLGLILYLLFWGGVKERLYSSRPAAANPPSQDLPQPAPAPAQPVTAPSTGGASAVPEIPGAKSEPATGASMPAGTTPLPALSGKTQLKVLGELANPPAATTAAPGSAMVASAELSLNVFITEKAWIWVGSGDTTLFSGLLEPNSSRKFPLSSILVLKIGNAGGVQLSVNDQRFAPLGKSGEVRVLQVSPDNYQQYMQPRPAGQ